MAFNQESKVTQGAGATDGPKEHESADGQHAAKLQRLIVRARTYHARHADWVHEFNTLTDGKCGNGESGISYRLLRNWQAEHHLSVDGLLGPATLARARHLHEQHGTAAHAPEAHKEEPKHEAKPTPKPVEHADPEAEHIVAEEHSNVPPPAHVDPVVEHKAATPPPPATSSAAAGAGAVAGEGHVVHPTANVREAKNKDELESTRGDKNQFAHSQDGFRKVYKIGDMETLVFLPAQGIVPPNLDVFLFFHGMYADFGTDDKDKNFNWSDPKNSRENPAQGADMAHAVTASARNVIAIMPIKWPGKDASYKKVVDEVVARVGHDMSLPEPLQVANVSVAGHSLGGAGLGRGVKDMLNEVTDVTLQDGGYNGSAFEESFKQVRDWLLLGKGPKTLRLITENDSKRGERNTERNKDGLNAASFAKQIEALTKDGKLNKKLTVGGESFGAPPKHFQGAFLESRVDIDGPDGRQATMYVFREDTNHFGVRDQSTQENIAAGPHEAGFGVHDGKQAGGPQGTPLATPQPHAHAPEKKHESAPALKATAPTESAAPVEHAVHKQEEHKEPHHAKEPAHHAKEPAHHAAEKHAAPDKLPTVTVEEKKPEPLASIAADVGDLQTAVDQLNDPKLSAVAKDFAALVAKSKEMLTQDAKSKKDGGLQNEVNATGRTEFVKRIGEVHAEIAALDGANPKVAAIKARMFRSMQELSPYHSQFRNVDILEANGPNAKHRVTGSTTVPTRTCNLTSLAMTLQSLGKGAHTYQGDHEKLLAVAKVFAPEMKAAELREDAAPGWASMEALRLPDLLELAAIAHHWTGKGGDQEVLAAGAVAWPGILNQDFLRQLAEQFGASATVKYFHYDPATATMSKDKGLEHWETKSAESKILEGQSHKQRSAVDKLIDARNKMEALEGKDDKAFKRARDTYVELEKGLHGALSGDSIEKKMPLSEYRKALVQQIGAELEGGAAVQCSVIDHYVRVHAIHDDHVVIDDPGQQARAHKKVLFEEARAQGMFYKRMVIR